MMNTRVVATVVAATLVAGTIAAVALAAAQGDDRSAPAPAPVRVATTPPPGVQPLTYVANPEDSEDATITDEMEANGGAGVFTEPPQ